MIEDRPPGDKETTPESPIPVHVPQLPTCYSANGCEILLHNELKNKMPLAAGMNFGVDRACEKETMSSTAAGFVLCGAGVSPAPPKPSPAHLSFASRPQDDFVARYKLKITQEPSTVRD